MTRRIYLIIALVVALVVAGGTFAYTQTSSSVTASVSSNSFATVTAASGGEAWAKHDGVPSWTPLEGSAGSVTAGDLYYIDPGDYAGDLLIMLYITNAGDLSSAYSYLNLEVQVWDYDADPEGWTSESVDYFLTLSNGYVAFILSAPGGDGYVVTIDDGSWYCIDGTGTLAPTFFIDVRQA
jgi:hypothetical protein